MKRPGYYVEGKWFQDRFHQARARAAHLSKEYGRNIAIIFVAHEPNEHPATKIEYEVGRVYNSEERA